MVKKAVQRGRSKQGGQGYSVRYVEPPSVARTKLADFFNILLGDRPSRPNIMMNKKGKKRRQARTRSIGGPVPG